MGPEAPGFADLAAKPRNAAGAGRRGGPRGGRGL
jgi:hypothetical protein